MKKLLITMLTMTSVVIFTACSNDDEPYAPQEVEITLDYTFIESGTMTRATGADVYNEFYEKYIKTRQLTPTTYSLTFTNKETGAVATINGEWNKKDGIRLPEGTYNVSGVSAPQLKYGKNIPSDTVYLSFDELVIIQKDMQELKLTANYDSYLLLFDATNNIKAKFYHYSSNNSNVDINKDLYKAGDLLSIFIRDFNYGNSYQVNVPKIILTRVDAKECTITLDKIPFEKSKYYYFNDMTNSFDIPPMESGN